MVSFGAIRVLSHSIFYFYGTTPCESKAPYDSCTTLKRKRKTTTLNFEMCQFQIPKASSMPGKSGVPNPVTGSQPFVAGQPLKWHLINLFHSRRKTLHT